MLKYIAKISMDIFPSVLATIIGAYIVNHYINARPAADAPAALVEPAQAGKNGKPADVANLPAPGVKAKGISEKNVTDKAAVEKPADKPVDQPGAETKAADVAPAETAPASPRGRPPAREKAVAKSTPVSTPAVAAPATVVPVVEANSAPSVAPAAASPDANDLARAAIERLRKFPESKSAEKSPEAAPQEAARAPEAPRAQDAPRVVTAVPSAVRPLPPPINVSTPSVETPATPPYTASVGNDDPNRLTPPADIPVPVIAPPLDLRADADGSMPRPKKTNVADEMLSGVKSMFHAVLPKSATPD